MGPLPAAATILVPLAEQARETQFVWGALVGVQLLRETQTPPPWNTATNLLPSAEEATEATQPVNGTLLENQEYPWSFEV